MRDLDPFPTLYEAFLRAAEADSGLRKESFLEQSRHHIATGKLRASGRRFSGIWDRRGRPTFIVCLPAEPPDHVEIPPLAMADHQLIFVDLIVDGPKVVDCQVVQGRWPEGATSRMSGWEDVRGVAGDVERLWPGAATGAGAIVASRRDAYEPGEKVKILLAKYFPRIPSKVEMPNSELVRCVQAKHAEHFKDVPAPDRKTILTHAGRLKRK